MTTMDEMVKLFGGLRFKFKTGRVEHHRVEPAEIGRHKVYPDFYQLEVPGRPTDGSGDVWIATFEKRAIYIGQTKIEVWYEQVR